MSPYTIEDLFKGVGSFEHAMRTQTVISGNNLRMTAGMAVGILASMMRAGLSAHQIEQLIDADFASNAKLLKQILQMYEGDDWSIHLWNLLPSGLYKVCTELCRHCNPTWRFDRTDVQADF